MPRVAAFDHYFSFCDVQEALGQTYMILEQLLLAKGKNNKMQKHINYVDFNIYSGLHTIIMDIVFWKTVILMFLMGAIVHLLKPLQLWIKFNICSL